MGTASDLNGDRPAGKPDRFLRVAADHALLRTRWLGRLTYEESWDLQRAFWEGRHTGRSASDYLLLQEHPHVYTLGRNGNGANLLITPERLVEVGAERFDIDRGGDITYHGPGQLVGYPIVALADTKRIVPYVRAVEEVLIRTLADFGIAARREAGNTGVWTNRGKVAALGVRVARHVTMHGFALNVDPDMAYFSYMHPCGITDRPVTSLVELLGRPVSIEEVVEVLVPRFQEVFGYARNEMQLGAFTRGQGRPREYEVDRLLADGCFSPKGRSQVPVTIGRRLTGEPPRAPWMKVTARFGDEYLRLGRLMRELDLHTVCEEAGCPNIYECWGQGTATMMILGDTCTRACGFCNVNTGRPQGPDLEEPFRVAEAVAAITIGRRLTGEPPRAPWMKVTARFGDEYLRLGRLMRELDLHTVCEEAGCPNIYECWGQGTATMMILGDTCTRACGFCNVNTGRPQGLDLEEPFRVAEAVAAMGLRHAVITSVNRDDLDDGGSTIFAQTVREARKRVPGCDVEVLIPDFKGVRADLERVLEAGPAVLNHNTETVLRLQREVRTSANYGRSLALLARAKWYDPAGTVKSGLIVGMGETREEVLGALADLRAVGVDIVTIGQYLRPTVRHRPIHRYVHPDEFVEYADYGRRVGLAHVESGPLVRSSYHARDSLGAATGNAVPVATGAGH